MVYQLSNLNKKIVEFLFYPPRKSVKEIAKEFNITEPNTRRHLQTLIKQDQVYKTIFKNGKEEYYYSSNNGATIIIERLLGIIDNHLSDFKYFPEEVKYFNFIKKLGFYKLEKKLD